MPRRARKLSESGIYHVILRGVDKQRIFEDEGDERRFLDILSTVSSDNNCKILAYCLMGNHAHMLLRLQNEPITSVVRRVSGKYASWFNTKYDRTGHLFQERFKSEPVEDDAYLLTVFRYILRNPVKAGLVAQPFDYKASSAADYLDGGGITDTALILDILPKEELVRFVQQENEDACLDVEAPSQRRVTDEAAREIIFDICGCSSVADFQSLDKAEQRDALVAMASSGISLRQANRLTGLSIGVIRGHLRKASS